VHRTDFPLPKCAPSVFFAEKISRQDFVSETSAFVFSQKVRRQEFFPKSAPTSFHIGAPFFFLAGVAPNAAAVRPTKYYL